MSRTVAYDISLFREFPMAPHHSPAFLALVNDAKNRIQELTVQQVRQKQLQGDPFYFVDVREESEWQAGHAVGAMYLGKGIIERDIETAIPDKEAEIILYCGGGFRSALAADNLKKMGYQKVISMDGGMRGWREAGFPEE
ncbi:MAG: rhodanese-like domain-containing protein [Thermostichus sp. BF3_bins_97]